MATGARSRGRAEEQSLAVLLMYAVGIASNIWISLGANDARPRTLQERGCRTARTMQGPTKDFVLAELAREKRQMAPAPMRVADRNRP